MPWNECKPMDERLRFVARLLEGEKMAPLCREFGISRVTGYKIFDRYKECGLDGLYDRSKAPYRQANKLPFQVERAILGIKKEFPSWGAPKIRDKLIREYPMIPPPAVSTIHAALDRNGLVKRRKRRRYKACGTPLSAAHAPNGLWCADYKGEFLLGNRQYCYPLTITDYRSRYLLACEGLESTKSKFAFSVFERTFRDFGLPAAIRTDNGTPFAAPWAMFGLSRLAVWWLRLGIRLQRIKPGKPQQNGRHERMHLTLKNGNHQTRRVQFPAAAGALRGLHPGLQPGAASPSARRRVPCRNLYTLSPPLRAAAGSRLPVPRSHRPRDALRPHLPRQSQNQPERRVGRAAGGHPRGRRPGLAGQLPGVRSGILRSR